MGIYTIFHLIGHNATTGDDGAIVTTDKVVVRVISDNLEDAMTRAKELITRSNWTVGEVVDYIRGQ